MESYICGIIGIHLMFAFIRSARILAFGALVTFAAFATSVPRMSFEELTDHSEMVVSGEVTRTWSEWDSAHKFIWTHHELAVSGTQKGTAAATVVVSEPGGIVGGLGMSIAGSVIYQNGDKVVVFLERMPNGLLRTTGWGQGKYRVDGGRLHADESLRAVEIVDGKFAASGSSLRSLEGMTVNELSMRVATRVRTQRQEGTR